MFDLEIQGCSVKTVTQDVDIQAPNYLTMVLVVQQSQNKKYSIFDFLLLLHLLLIIEKTIKKQ